MQCYFIKNIDKDIVIYNERDAIRYKTNNKLDTLIEGALYEDLPIKYKELVIEDLQNKLEDMHNKFREEKEEKSINAKLDKERREKIISDYRDLCNEEVKNMNGASAHCGVCGHKFNELKGLGDVTFTEDDD